MPVVLYMTHFADAPVLVGLTVVLCAALALAGCGRAAATFGVVFLALVVSVVAAKGVVGTVAGLSDATGLRSPSGHVAGAIVIISGATMWAGRGSWVVAALLGAATIAYTRVALGYHTVADVFAGAAIGAAVIGAATMLGATSSWVLVPRRVGGPLVGVLVAAAIFLNGWHPGIGRYANGYDFPSWRDYSTLGATALASF